MSQEDSEPFSLRYGYQAQNPEITIREDAPEWLRFEVADIAWKLGLSPALMRTIVCRMLLAAPKQNNWSDGNIWDEVVELLGECEWYSVYDIAEALYAALEPRPATPWQRSKLQKAAEYEERLNKLFQRGGVGWQMRSGRIVVRGSEPFEAVTREASKRLLEHGRPIAAREIHDALDDLSRRPNPKVSGAIQHAMVALECVACDVAGDPRATLGEVLKKHAAAIGIPPPLDQALIKLWGYASEHGRHLREGREPAFQEAELVVTVAAAVSLYLSREKAPGHALPGRCA